MLASSKTSATVDGDPDDQNLWTLVTGFELVTGAAFVPIWNCFFGNQWGASSTTEHIQPVLDVRKKYKDMASGRT